AEDLTVNAVVVILSAEAGQQHFPRTVGDQIIVLVLVDVEVGRLGNVDLRTGDADAHRRIEVAGEDRHLVGDAVAVGVFEHFEHVVGRIGDVPAVLRPFGDPHPAVSVYVDGDGVDHHRLGGEQLHFESVGRRN